MAAKAIISHRITLLKGGFEAYSMPVEMAHSTAEWRSTVLSGGLGWSRKANPCRALVARDEVNWMGEAKRAMYIHMFAFRFKVGVSDAQKKHVVEEIAKLQGQIAEVKETWVGLNDSPRGQGYELGGVMKFADKAAMETYGVHPVHQDLLRWLMPLIEPIEVDFAGQS